MKKALLILVSLLLITAPLALAESTTTSENDILGFIQEYAIVAVVFVCAVVGWLIKHTVPFLDNKFIPLILALLGIFMATWISEWTFTFDILVRGLASGLSSVGAHQLITKLYDKYLES